jgi:hypothetical protein
MTTPIFYNRYFNKATAQRGEEVQVFIQLFFLPVTTGNNIWFDNVGDNLGGSTTSNGPLIEVTGPLIPIYQNLLGQPFHDHSVGQSGSPGCFRFWSGGSTYPSLTEGLYRTFHPEDAAESTSITVYKSFTVHPSATIGTVIGAPTRATPCSDINYTANKLMIDLGSDMILYILNTTAPSGWSRTLTIVP